MIFGFVRLGFGALDIRVAAPIDCTSEALVNTRTIGDDETYGGISFETAGNTFYISLRARV